MSSAKWRVFWLGPNVLSNPWDIGIEQDVKNVLAVKYQAFDFCGIVSVNIIYV